MSRTPCPPTVYVAVWDEERVIKPGFTMARRWRDWEIRGARIVFRQEFSHYSRAFDAETAAHSCLGHWWPLAFRSRSDSRALMGTCGGWREAYRVTDVEGAIRMLARIVRTHAAHDAAHASGHAMHRVMPRARDERTNDTDGRSWSPREPSLTLINARACDPRSTYASPSELVACEACGLPLLYEDAAIDGCHATCIPEDAA